MCGGEENESSLLLFGLLGSGQTAVKRIGSTPEEERYAGSGLWWVGWNDVPLEQEPVSNALGCVFGSGPEIFDGGAEVIIVCNVMK